MAQGKCILKRWENKNEESSFSAAGLPRAAVFGSAAASNRGTTLQTLATHDASFCSVKKDLGCASCQLERPTICAPVEFGLALYLFLADTPAKLLTNFDIVMESFGRLKIDDRRDAAIKNCSRICSANNTSVFELLNMCNHGTLQRPYSFGAERQLHAWSPHPPGVRRSSQASLLVCTKPSQSYSRPLTH